MRNSMIAAVSTALRELLCKPPGKIYDLSSITCTMNIEPEVFLALFAHTAAYARECFFSLVSHGALSRNITFAELDVVLGRICAAWHTRDTKHSKRVTVDKSKPVRVSIHHVNAKDFDHSACPLCTFTLDGQASGE